MKTRTETLIDVDEWNKLVTKTYSKPYDLQQQDGCQDRGVRDLIVPGESNDDEMNDSIPEIVNHETMGVKFAVWLARNPKKRLSEGENCRADKWAIDLWWQRNFYPDLQTVANDLHAKGLLKAGKYLINIDW